MNKRNLLKTFLFVSVLIILVNTVSNLLTPKWYFSPGANEGETNRFQSFYMQPKNTLDYLVLGASHTLYSINPMQIYARTGFTGYVLGSTTQSIDLSYYWLKEACKYQLPKYVFFDISSLLYSNHDINRDPKVAASKALIYMRPSLLKLQAAFECSNESVTPLEIIFPLFQFHSRWNDLKEEDFGLLNNNYVMRGAYISFDTKMNTYKSAYNLNYPVNYEYIESDNKVSFYETTASSKAIEYFEKMLFLCKEKGITLIPIKCPTLNWDINKTNTISSYLEKYNMSFINISSGDNVGIDWKTDTCDSGNHTNYYGSTKVSKYIADYLSDLKTLNDHRRESIYSSWDADLKVYQIWEQKQLLSETQKIINYFHALNKHKKDICVIISVKDEACDNWDSDFQIMTEKLGLKSDFYDNSQNSYIAVLDGGTPIFEKWESAPMTFNTKLKIDSGHDISLLVKSGGYTYGDTSSIKVNGTEYSLNTRGFNIVAIDKQTGKVLSSSVIDTHDREPSLSFDSSFKENYLYDDYIRGSKPIADGIYLMTSAMNDDYLFDISGDPNESGANLVLWNATGDIQQQFEIQYVDDGLYTIKNLYSNKYLTVDCNGNSERTKVIQENYTGLSTQKWYIIENSNSSLIIMSHYNKLMMSVSGSVQEPVFNIQLSKKLNEPWQQFSIQKID